MDTSTYRLLCGTTILLEVNSALGIPLSSYAEDELHIEVGLVASERAEGIKQELVSNDNTMVMGQDVGYARS
eukprot:6610515-Ditylum_brightwellii.AAC.1